MVQKALRITLFFLIVGLSFYIITGFSTLMMADDYCYFSLIKNKNFLSAIKETYMSAILIAGNRFSATFFSILGARFGTNIVKVTPLLTISSFLLALIFMVTKKMELIQTRRNLTLTMVISLTFLGILFYIAPSRFQNIYWFSGVIAYTTPIILYSLLIGLFISFINHQNKPNWYLFILFVLSFITTGFSETSAIAFLVHFCLIMVYFILKGKFKAQELEFYIPLIGLMIGIILLIISPSALSRNSGVDYGIKGPFKLLSTSFIYGFDFMVDILSSYILPLTVLMVGMISFGGLIEINSRIISLRCAVIFSIFTFFSTFIVISASMAPQIFAFGAYPNVRSQLIPSFFLLLGMSIIGITIGIITVMKLKINQKILILPLMMISIYLLRAGFTEYSYIGELSERSKLWNERHYYINNQVEIGLVDVKIPGIDSIETIMDFNPVCLREYYQIEAIEILE